jgi:hypothetical protein
MHEHELDARGAPGFEAIATASLSDAGRVRAENQDAVALIANTSGERLLLVADEMGGHRGGETASRICLKTIERVFREPHGTPEQRLIRGFELANEEVYSHALANPELRGWARPRSPRCSRRGRRVRGLGRRQPAVSPARRESSSSSLRTTH